MVVLAAAVAVAVVGAGRPRADDDADVMLVLLSTAGSPVLMMVSLTASPLSPLLTLAGLNDGSH